MRPERLSASAHDIEGFWDGRITCGGIEHALRLDLTKDGVAHYGLMPDLLAATARQPKGRQAVDRLFHSADAYVRMWRRAVSAQPSR